jgi:type-F conjugative transfer system secretin TraK
MILKHLVCAFTLFILSTTAHAAIVRPLDEMKVIETHISQDGLTRIKVQDDRILHVFGSAGEYILEVDENQGQIFIRPTLLDEIGSKASKPISLTLTTEEGHTQDLRLIPKDQASEALILKADNTIKQEIEKEKRASAPLFHEEVEALIQALSSERIPLGYKEVPISLTNFHEPYFLVRELQGETLRGLTYRIQNKTSDRVVLSESELDINLRQGFGGHKVIAILISKKTLNPGEETDVYVVARTN